MSSLFLLFKSSTWTFSPAFSMMSSSRAWLSLSSWKMLLVTYEGMRKLKNARRKVKVLIYNQLVIIWFPFWFSTYKIVALPTSVDELKTSRTSDWCQVRSQAIPSWGVPVASRCQLSQLPVAMLSGCFNLHDESANECSRISFFSTSNISSTTSSSSDIFNCLKFTL